MKRILILVTIILILIGCKPTPISDEQIKMMAALCEKHEKVLSVYNTGAVSRADCVSP